ncbi:MAG: hypothetical protein VYB73_03420 [Verrucomicrobiota bacterium]|nr:hypothetical protein [Verrucomicrobiota bacterium]
MNLSRLIFTLTLISLVGIALMVDGFFASLLTPFGVRILLVHTIFLTCALTVSFPMMLGFAFGIGFIWDASQMAVTGVNDVGFGYSIVLLGLTGALMQGVCPLFERGRWEVPVVLVGVATALLMAMEWFFVSFGRAKFIVPEGFWKELWVSSLLGMLASPIFFYLIFKLSRLTDCPILSMKGMRGKEV